MTTGNQKFDVSLYKSVRIRFKGVEAAGPEEAMQKADEKCSYPEWLQAEQLEDEETFALGATVDFPDDPEYTKTIYVQGPSATLYLKDGADVDRLTGLLHRIDSAAAGLPSFSMRHEGGEGAAVENIVEAIQIATHQIAALAKLLSNARGAWADGDFENLGAILSGDVCRDVLDSVENKTPIEPELLAEILGEDHGERKCKPMEAARG